MSPRSSRDPFPYRPMVFLSSCIMPLRSVRQRTAPMAFQYGTAMSRAAMTEAT